MRIAVTDHAVGRYKKWVQGAQDFNDESVRDLIRHIVFDGFERKTIRDHPTEKDRRIIPFNSGKSTLYLSIGPNKTQHLGDWAVIGVLFEKELTKGRRDLGVSLGDVAPELKTMAPSDPEPPRYVISIGTGNEIYKAKDLFEVRDILEKRQPKNEKVFIYELSGLQVEMKYEIKKT